MIFIGTRQQLLLEQCTTNAVIIGYCNEQIYYLYMYKLFKPIMLEGTHSGGGVIMYTSTDVSNFFYIVDNGGKHK